MAEHNDLGKKGEEWARNYLIKKGYHILATNFKYKKAEIDIVAEDAEKNILVVVEVKTRYENALEGLEKAVSKKKQKSIITATQNYIVSNEIELETRFDIIRVILDKKGPKFEHIEDAFYPSL